mmetsp:Transcript_85130/g.214653  ORF Transcript_85130/g.214653 Transcript_85130/m.214653 type:complete len:238 (-) Transcript_85130:155-868(-)
MVDVTVAAVGAAILAATSLRTAQQKGRKAMRLPEVLAYPQDDSPIRIGTVHVHCVDMAPRYQSEQFTIQVKYGTGDTCLRCDAATFSPVLPAWIAVSRSNHRRAPVASSVLNSTCMFLLSRTIERIQPVIQLKIRSAGLRKRLVAKATITLLDLLRQSEVELPLHDSSGESLGRVIISGNTQLVNQEDLRGALALAQAVKQRDTYLIPDSAFTVLGTVVDENSDSSDGVDCQMGSPW